VPRDRPYPRLVLALQFISSLLNFSYGRLENEQGLALSALYATKPTPAASCIVEAGGKMVGLYYIDNILSYLTFRLA
jgi:hypothetical protein